MIQRSGQILPYFVMDVAGRFPGLTGLFISGVVSAALRLVSRLYLLTIMSILKTILKLYPILSLIC